MPLRIRLNRDYLQNFVLGDDQITGIIEIVDPDLRRVLEQLQLLLSDGTVYQETTAHGLGVNNLLFMATELLLLRTVGGSVCSPLLLIEEPEAHLHPQSQLRLMEFLSRCGAQVIVTTHSPNVASVVPVNRIVVMSAGKAFPLGEDSTKLDKSDYGFLSRFLDVTKSNLFFARGVIIVEGPAEQLLIPAIADALNRPLTKHGVSIVCAGHTGLFRYSRIFQRKAGPEMPVRVACVSDRDIPPDCAKKFPRPVAKTEGDYGEKGVADRLASRHKVDGGPVRSFVSPRWTLEYDLALGGLRRYVNQAIHLACSTEDEGFDPFSEAQAKMMRTADSKLDELMASNMSDEEIALHVYEPLLGGTSKALAAQFLAAIIEHEIQKPGIREQIAACVPQYLRDAINYVTRDDSDRR